MSIVSTLAVALLAGVPEVTIADEHREGGDPSEIKIRVTNRTEEAITISFSPDGHRIWFKFHVFDERGRPVVLERREDAGLGGYRKIIWIKPGKTVIGYLSPGEDYVIPSGRYQVSLTYSYPLSDHDTWFKVESNRITKVFSRPSSAN